MHDEVSGRRWSPGAVLGLISCALIGVTLLLFLTSALSPLIGDELGLDEATLGLAVSAFLFAGAASSLPAGRVTDRFGSSVSLRIGLVIVATGGLGVAFATTDGAHLVAWLVLGGLSIGFVDTGSARAIAAVTPLTRQGIAFGVKEANIPAASMVAGAVVPILGERVGWRPAFAAAACLALLVAVVVPRGIDRRRVDSLATRATAGPPPHDASPDDASPDDGSPNPSSSHAPPATPAPDRSGSSPRWALPALAIAAGLGGASATAAATFLVPAGVASGWQPGAAGILLAVASAAGIAVRLVLGLAADRARSGELRILAITLGLGTIGIAGLAGGGVLLVPAALLALGAGWGWTGLVFFAAVRMVPAAPARGAGMVLLGLAGGGGAGPLLFGPVAAGPGYPLAWTLAAIAMAVSAVIVLVLIVARRHDEQLVDTGTLHDPR